MQIKDLDDKYLKLIFNKYFPLQEVIIFRRVCHKWHFAVQQVCSGQKSLKIFYSFQEFRDYRTDLDSISRSDHEDFQIREIGDDLVLEKNAAARLKGFHYRFLGRLFPNLEKLVVCNSHEKKEFNVPILLKNWPGLNTLCVSHIKKMNKQEQGEFWNAIRSLSSIKRLHFLRVSGTDFDFPPLMHSILMQLEHFTTVYFDFDENFPLDIIKSWKHFGPNMKQLICEPISCSFDQMKEVFAYNRHLSKMANNLTHLYASIAHHDIGKQLFTFRYMCQKFESLTHFTVFIDFAFCYLDLVPYLAQLKQLTELRFHVDENQARVNLKKASKLPALTSVKHLLIGYYSMSDFPIPVNPTGPLLEHNRGLLFQSFAIIFPQVEKITIKSFFFNNVEVLLQPGIQILSGKMKKLRTVIFQADGIDNFDDERYNALYKKYVAKKGKPVLSYMCG